MTRFAALFLILLFATNARTAELFEMQRSTRVLGMGGVGLPFVQPVDAVLQNPAVLADEKRLDWELFDLQAGTNGKEVYDLYQDMKNTNCQGATCYETFYGKPLRVQIDVASKLAIPRIGLTAFNSGHLEGTLHNPAFPTMNLTYLNDWGFAAGYGFPVAPTMNAGVTVKRISRAGGTKDISLSTLSSLTDADALLNQFSQQGVGYGFDLGAQWKIPGPLDTVIALDWQDVGSTAFAPPDDTKEAPPRIADNLSLGIGSSVEQPGFKLRGGIEYRHITTVGEQIGKKIHVGAELGLPIVDLRAGLNEGYPTLGAGVDFYFLRFDGAMYTEETGVYPGQSPSTRYQVGVSLDLSFDADFNFSSTTADGRRRSLKQRR